MNRIEFANKLISQVWNIPRERGRTLLGSIVARLRSERPAEDKFGAPLPAMQIVGDVAVIPISGALSIAVPDWLKSWGVNLTDANDVAEEVAAALANPEVSMIVQQTDSPGGLSVAGSKLFELFESANRKKPVFTWIPDGADCCSAAYNSAASSVAIFSGRHAAAIGSIGSYLAFLDDSAYWAELGLKWEVFRSGEFKGMGEDGMTESQRVFLQASVDECGARFRANVAKYRTEIPAEDMQGQWFSAQEAQRRGFIAGTATDLSGAIAKFRRLI